MTGRPKKLLDQVRDAVPRKHYSLSTEQTCVSWIKRHIVFLHRDVLRRGSWGSKSPLRCKRTSEPPQGAVDC